MPKDELGRQRIWLGFFERVGVGHSPWRSFKHPSLGDVAIGGFEPFSRRTPPQSYLASAVAPVVRFALNAATLLPEIELGSVKVEPLAGSLYAVEIELRNAGFLPTQTLKAEAIGRAAPTVVKLDLGKAGRVVAGSARMLVRRLAGGASVKRRVVLRMEGDGQAELEVWSERAGRALRLVKIDKDL